MSQNIPNTSNSQAALTPTPAAGANPILELRNLHVSFVMERGTVRAVRGVDLTLHRRATLGLVGESGCGKSVTAMTIMRLIKSPPGKIVNGEILLQRQDERTVDLAQLDPAGAEMRAIRGAEIAIIFQEPMTSLNPLRTIGNQISEAVKFHQHVGETEGMARAEQMLDKVRIAAPKQRAREYPHQLSGGMRQRAMIAMALSCNPSILIADEPTTALDVTVQAQILDLMQDLQDDFHSSILMITHNLGVVSQMADYVAVMYLGKVVEYAPKRPLFKMPLHPYTVGLLQSVPVLGRKKDKLVPIKGMVPSLKMETRGCPFASRCPRVMAVCRDEEPELREIQAEHYAACWLYEN
jgi:peptide/nickel transport system ATP-binding protein/oligopeptide transport system ATP-binding protein